MICPLLSLPAIPLLGCYNIELYDLKPVLTHGKYDGPLPSALTAALCRLPAFEQLECIEVEYDCRDLHSDSTLNLLFHSTVFYDARENRTFSTVVNAAYFSSDNCTSQYSVSSQRQPDWLTRNPLNLLSSECRSEVTVHPRGEDVCCSPNNCKVKVQTIFPVVEFYTVCLVPYCGKFVRGIVCRHVLWFRNAEILNVSLSEAKEFLQANLSFQIIEQWSSGITKNFEALTHFLMWFIWLVDGCPSNSTDYGKIVLESLFQQQNPILQPYSQMSHQRYIAALEEKLLEWVKLFCNRRFDSIFAS